MLSSFTMNKTVQGFTAGHSVGVYVCVSERECICVCLSVCVGGGLLREVEKWKQPWGYQEIDWPAQYGESL